VITTTASDGEMLKIDITRPQIIRRAKREPEEERAKTMNTQKIQYQIANEISYKLLSNAFFTE